LRDRVRAAVLGESLAQTGMFERRTLQHLVDAHQSGLRDYSAPLWTLLMFDSFLRSSGLGEQVQAPPPLRAQAL
jgi:asparagine synthase (glutamine-hydrolysing)